MKLIDYDEDFSAAVTCLFLKTNALVIGLHYFSIAMSKIGLHADRYLGKMKCVQKFGNIYDLHIEIHKCVFYNTTRFANAHSFTLFGHQYHTCLSILRLPAYQRGAIQFRWDVITHTL